MLIVSKRYHKLMLKCRSMPIWTHQVYYNLLALKNFWKAQGINRN